MIGVLLSSWRRLAQSSIGTRVCIVSSLLCVMQLSSASAQAVQAPGAPVQRTPALQTTPAQSPPPQPPPPLPSIYDNPPADQLMAAPPEPKANGSSVDLRRIPPISGVQPHTPQPASGLVATEHSKASPAHESFGTIAPSFLHYFGPYRRVKVPELGIKGSARLESLVRDGKLYLSLHDAIDLAIENNLDVEVERYNLLLAETDITRAKGGGSTRGIDMTLSESPSGVGGPGSPLLDAAAAAVSPTTPSVTDLSSLSTTSSTQTNLAQGSSLPYSSGPAVPLFDPNLIGDAGWLRRSNTVSLTSTSDTTGGVGGSAGATTTPGSVDFTAMNLSYLQGFSTGAQLEAVLNNDSQVIYADQGQWNPFHSPSSSLTFTQPLLQGFGRGVNLRYLRIANLDRSSSRLLFEQQLINTVYGISRLYYDLVSLGENVGVKEETLTAAQKLASDDEAQVEEGTLAPIELARARALVSASKLDLVQAQGQYRQEEVILRSQLIRSSADLAPMFSSIVPTEHILVPDHLEDFSVPDLLREGLAHRRDLAQAGLQVKAGEISVEAAQNAVLPQLNVYANVQGRGSSETPYQVLGSPGTGLPNIPATLALGGLRTSTIYQAGVQLTLPLRNRVAQADAARDAVQLRQTEAGTLRLENQVRTDIENSVVALQNAESAYKAAVESRQYQEVLLSAEVDKLSVGASTNFLIVQDEAYLAQARSTEVAARSDWMKARIALDRSLGNTLEKNGIVTDDAIEGVAH
jgi:outer membrane protein